MVVTNTGGPLVFDAVTFEPAENHLTDGQVERLAKSCRASPGQAHAIDQAYKRGQLVDGVVEPAEPAAVAHAFNPRARDEAAWLSQIGRMGPAELDSAFQAETDPVAIEAITGRLKELAAVPAGALLGGSGPAAVGPLSEL